MDDLIGVVILLIFGAIGSIIKYSQKRRQKRPGAQQSSPVGKDTSLKPQGKQEEYSSLSFSLERLYEKALSMEKEPQQREQKPIPMESESSYPLEPTESTHIEAPAISLEELFDRTIEPVPLQIEEPAKIVCPTMAIPEKKIPSTETTLVVGKKMTAQDNIMLRMKSLNPWQQAVLFREILDPPLCMRNDRFPTGH